MADTVVSSGITSDGITLENDSMTILDGGIANNTTISSDGILYIFSGGIARDIILSQRNWEGGSLFVNNGGMAINVTVEGYCNVKVSSGGIISSATIYPDGAMDVSGGGTIRDILIDYYGQVYVWNASVYNTVVNSGGILITNGYADGIVISKGAQLQVEGGTVTNIVWTPCEGRVSVMPGAGTIVTYASQYSGVYYGSANQLVSNVQILESHSVGSSERMYIMSGGTASHISGSGSGWFEIAIWDGGVMNDAVISSGMVEISSGGIANDVSLQYGDIWISSGGVANSVFVNASSWLFVESGGTATNVFWTPCVGTIEAYDGCVSFAPGQHSGVYYGANNQLLSNTMEMSSKTVGTSALMYVMQNGVAKQTTVNGSGSLFVYGNGVAEDTMVNSNGCLMIMSGGTATKTSISGGWGSVDNGGEADFTTIGYGGKLNIYKDGLATDVVISSGGSISVQSGGTATNINAASGAYIGFTIAPDTYASGTSNGSSFEFKDALISGVSFTNGYVDVASGGRAESVTLVNSGWMHLGSGGKANHITLNSKGTFYVSNGGIANSTVVSASGNFKVGFSGIANSAIVYSGGSMDVYFAGIASEAIISGGSATVRDEGILHGVSMYGGKLYVSSEGKLTGNMTFENGAVVSAYEGSILDFDLTGTTVGGVALVNNLSLVQGTPFFTITVDGTQENRTYALAGGAAGFNSTISIVNRSDEVLDTFAVGETITIDGMSYALSLSDAVLSVSISGNTESPVTSSGLVLRYESRTVNSGEIYEDTTLNDFGNLYVSSGGIANNTTVNGIMYVSNGGTANSTTLNYAGYLYVSDGGMANSTTVNSYGYLYVSSGGTATDIVWTPCVGHVYVYGHATFVSQYSGVYYGSNARVLSKSDVMDGMMLNSYGEINVMTGGTVNSTTVSSTGYLYVYSAGVANNTTVSSGGYLEVYSGGTANEIIENGGYVSVADGAKAAFASNTISRLILAPHGAATVHSGTTANSTSISGGYLHVSSGGTANSTTITSGGLYVSSGGVADDTTVYGVLSVFSGGTANNTTVYRAGRLWVVEGGTANNTKLDGQYACAIVSSGGVANYTTVDHYCSMVIRGGTANSTTLSSRGSMSVSSGGKMTGQMTFAAGAVVSAFDGAILDFDLTETTVGGTALVNNLSLVQGTPTYTLTVDGTQENGTYTLAGGATSFSGTISIVNTSGSVLGTFTVGETITIGGTSYALSLSDAVLSVSISGNTGSPVPVTSSGLVLTNESRTVNSGEIFEDTMVNSCGQLYIDNGGTANSTTVNYQGELYIHGVADNTMVNSRGYLYVSSGGTANNTTVNSIGDIDVYSGGTANSTTVNMYGHLNLYSGGMANSTTVNSVGYLYISSGGMANNTTVNSRGYLYVSSGGTANKIIENGGYVSVADGANVVFASNTISGLVFSNGSATVHSGTTANSTMVDGKAGLPGYLHVFSSGIVNCTTVSHGYIYVSSGGTANSTTVNPVGWFYVSSGGTANSTTVNSRGYLIVSSGGIADRTTVNWLGFLCIYSSGIANNTTVSSGYLCVYSGGTADNTIVSSGGSVIVSSGGTANNTTVNSGGSLYVSSEGKLTGNMTFANGAVVSAYSGSILDFDITQAAPGETALVNNLSIVRGAPTYTLTVDGTQENGDYFLADGASTFNGTIFVVNTDGESLGELNTGETLTVSQTAYTLSLIDSTLILSVGPTVHTDFEVSDFIAPTAFVSGETASFSWNLTNNGEMPLDGIRQSLYLVNADDPNRKTLLKSAYLTDLPRFGETAAQTMDLTWNDTMGYANSLFQVVVEADGDVQSDDNTAISTSQYHFEQKLSIEKLPDSFTENTGRIRVVARRTGSPDEALSAQIVLTDPSGLVSTPQTVTFAAGESEKVFYLTVGNNAEYQGNAGIQVGLHAQGYEGYSKSVTLTDDELPSLSFAVTAEELTEGDTFTAFGKVQLDHALDYDLRVKLAYDKTQLSGIPDYVVIKAGETEAAFALTVIDDATAEIDKTVKLTATADGVKSGTASLLIHDNDVPAIALSVNKTVVSEGDGVYALVGTITRTDNSTNYVKVKFVDVDNSGLILPSTVTLGTGAQSVNFYIGIVDNALVDGDRMATVKANIYIDSCGCTVIPVSGETQVSFTILDNDGEALGLSFSRSNVTENTTGAAKLTITRNTVNGDALTVNLSVTGSSLLDLPDTVQFEAGQNSVTIDVNTLTDGINTGNQMAVVTASAEGYASAAGYLNISDVDLPDFVISEVSPAETPAYAGKTTLVNLTLANSGFQAYSGKVNVKLSLSNGTELGTYKVNGPFEVGETKQVGFYVNLPEITGTQTILAEVDPDNLISELNDGNNTAFSASFEVKLDYIVTVETEPEVLYTKAPITVTGTTKRMDGTAIGNMPVEILLKAATGEKLLKTTSDAEGNYALTVDPSDLYAGSYAVYAGNLGSYGAAQDRVEIAGMKVNQSRTAFTWDVENRSTTEGSFTVSNLSGVALSGVTIHAVNAPDNFVFVSDGPAALDANGQLTVNYTITAAGVTEGGGYELIYGWQKIDFVAESDEGVTTEFSGYFYSNPQIAVLTLSETKDVRTLYSGKESFYEFQITNTGFGDTGEIRLNLPENDLIKIISNPVIENLAYGESATVTLKVNPVALGNGLSLNAPYTGSIGISAENAKAAKFAFDYTFVTNDKGNITITLTDEWTQYAADHPMLSGAKVGIYNAYTEKLVKTEYSDKNGVVNISDLAEGKYILKYSADGHNNAQEVVTVRGGETLELNTFLQVSTVKYTWDVQRVELMDTYEIVLSTEFETNVPVPVVTIDGPTVLPELAWGESTLMNFTVTNHGLIAAQDFTLSLPELQMGYEWKVLNDQPVDIAPNSSVNYTVKLNRGITSISTIPVQAVEYAYDEMGNAIGMKSTIDGITTVCDFDGAILSQTDGEMIVHYFYDDDMNLAYYEETDISGEGFARYDSKGNVVSCGIPGMTFSFENGLITGIQIDDSNSYNCQFSADNFLTSFDVGNVRYHLTWEDSIVVDIDFEDTSLACVGDESNSSRESDIQEILDNVKLFKHTANGWKEVGKDNVYLDKDKETIVIVHGLNNTYDQDWINQMKDACLSTGDYQVVSVYWDDWAAFGPRTAYNDDLGNLVWVPRAIFKNIFHYASKYLAATAWASTYWLGEISHNVTTVIGHSYGAHIAGLLSQKLGEVKHLIALDPAEERTIQDTHIIKQAYSSTIGWSGKVSQQWGRNSADVVEVYKSSSVLGGGGEGDIFAENYFNYGHYNYLLAKTGVFDPSARIYNWDGDWLFLSSRLGNHSLACDWLVEMINQEKTIGGWYNNYLPSSYGWCGVINSETHQLECITVDPDGKKHFVKKEEWSGYSNNYVNYNEAIEKHAMYVDISLDDKDIYSLKSIYNWEFDGKPVLYQDNNKYFIGVPIANVANNLTITSYSQTDSQRDQKCSIEVYLEDKCVGKEYFTLQSNRLIYVPVEIELDPEVLRDSSSVQLVFKAGVGKNGQFINYDLDTSNNIKIVNAEIERVNCSFIIKGDWFVTCNGLEEKVISHVVNAPWCNNTITTSFEAISTTNSNTSGNVPSRVSSNNSTSTGSISSPSISTTCTTCKPYVKSGSASATPDGGLMTYATVLSDSVGDAEPDSICAHVKVEFKQTAVMSREGFEGTLTLTNEAATEMTNITFTATVLNSAGEDVSDLFEIAYNGTDGFTITQNGALEEYGLGNKGTGTFTVLYVPGRYTSTEGPEDYQFTGTISYTDSLVGDVSIDLTPITLTVNPSPSLQLHYFVERDVYADDPFTDAIEKSVPAEISVLVVNAGKGDARNFSLSGLAPEIVDNQKGLLLNYTMTDAAMNGVKNDNGIVDVNFGTVAANSSAVAQWWYETNVQGHYSDYSVNFTQMDYSYVDLYGNTRYVAAANRPDVSLIESADIHELIRSVQCGDDELPDFLVDDLADDGDTPDTLYLSTGAVEDVNAVFAAVSNGTFGTNDVTITLTADFAEGWNYLRILDPGNGDYELTGIIRDGEALNARNFWQTDRYYLDELGVKYENRLHLLDYAEQAGTVEYTLTYTARDKNPLAVTSITGADAVVKSAVGSLTVTFSKAVNASSFTWADLDLFRQGDLANDLITDAVTVTQIDSTTFEIGNLGELTAADGYYQLIVRTDGITDTVGNAGSDGKALTWTMASAVPAVASIGGIDDLMNTKADSIEITFTASVNAATLTPAAFRVNGASSDALVIAPVGESNTKFTVSGISGLLTEGGNVLEIDLTQIAGINGNTGLQTSRKEWTIDLTSPTVQEISESLGVSGAAPSELVFEATEDVTVSADALMLKKDGVAIASDSMNIAIDGKKIIVTGINGLLDGAYELELALDKIADAAGNTGSGTAVKTWTIDKTAPAQLVGFSLAASCDMGESDSDGRTSTRDLTLVGTLPEAGLRVRIYQQTGTRGRTLLRELTPDGTSLETAVKVQGGHSMLIAELTDAAGNTSETSLSVFVDELAVSAEFQEIFEDVLTGLPQSITFELSEEVVGLTAANFTLSLDGENVPLDGMSIVQTDALTYVLSGINASANGAYTLSLDMTGLVKKSTGLACSGIQSTGWSIYHADPPTVVSTSINSEQMIDGLATFSIVFSAAMNCDELIESGAITHAVRIVEVDSNNNVMRFITLSSDDFQYIEDSNTLVWNSAAPLSEGGNYRLVLDTGMLKSEEGVSLAGSNAESGHSYQASEPSEVSAQTQDGGYSVPVWYDYNGDGKLDLLVGEKATETTGRIRVLLNTGTTETPVFGDYTYLPGTDGDWTIAASNCLGVAPHFADVNGDGVDDLVYGTSDGRIEYALKSNGVFGTGVSILADGTAIDIGNRAVIDLVDWNGDGHLDIVSGAMDGKIYLFVNNGDWTFSAAQTLSIQLENGWSAPAVADLDGDGDLDVVLGDAKGNLYRFLNNGDGTFAVVDIAAGESDRSRPFICDVNGDSILDITVGYKSGQVSVLYGEKGSVVAEDFHINSSPVFSGTPSAKVEDYQVTLSWEPASDDFGVAGYKVKIGDTEYQTTATTLTLTDVDVGTYSYQVGAYDEAGLEGWSSLSTFEVKDVTLPVLNGLPFAKVWKNTVRFSWESASDNVAVAGYRIELNGQTYDTSLTVQFVSGLEVGDYEYRVGGIDTSGLITWSEKQSFTVTELADTLDHVLTETVPTANYGPGCVASSIGMLLGYYDKYGYCGFDVSDLIQGEIELESRNKADALLNTFIATPGYTTRFIGQSESAERPYTLTEQNELNTAAWDSLADWLGTGQKWRGNEDYATAYYYGLLDDVMESQDTYSISGTALPVKFADFKYGLNLFVESVNYKLDGELTRTVKADTAANGTFSFADYTAEIDAGRGVLISLASPGNLGHMVLGYGYNEATGEIIFDDTTESGRRMVWNGTYQYAGHEYRIQSITTIVLDTDGLKVLPPVSDVAPQTQTWEKTEDAAQYIMEYSTDNFEHVIQLVVESNSIDSFQMPAGNYQMRVKADGGEWTVIDPVVAEEATDEPKLIRSNADGNADVFFVNTVGTWESGYVAQHVGSTDDDTWGGTEEYASLFGKNKLMDIIEGSTDANVLLMTDDAIGDALFVDDIYSESPDELGLSQSRIAQIDEIRAGAGNDVVDMTSQHFEYIGDGLTIRGGEGNDTIWANKGNNFLFGDAGKDRIVGASGNDVIVGGNGNDSMHGGGGDDVFAFCNNWGADTVQQLETGTVTLWFASGDESKWNADTLTYTDGDNSVTVKGVASVTLKFGDDGSEQYAKLASAGAFAEFTSQKIFEESGKELLA